MTRLLLAIGVPITITLVLRHKCLLIRVTGDSMLSTYRDGDLLLGLRRRRLRVGQVVVFRTPPTAGDQSQPFRIKRVTAIGGQLAPGSVAGRRPGDRVPPGHLAVAGDNPKAEDSRHYGYISRHEVVAVVASRRRPTGPDTETR